MLLYFINQGNFTLLPTFFCTINFLDLDKGTEFDWFSGRLRNKVGDELGLIDKNTFKMCWIVDFPFYKENEETGAVESSHNPFSMPQGGMDDLLNKNPLFSWKVRVKLLDVVYLEFGLFEFNYSRRYQYWINL